MPTVIYKTLSGRARTGMSLWGAIRCLTLGEMLQGSAELAAVVSLLVAATIWFITWVKPNPGIHVSAAIYTYERGFILEGTTKTTLSHMQNLLSDCTIWRRPPVLPKSSVKIIEVQAWILSKYLLENASGQAITHIRMAIASPLLNQFTELSATLNVQAKGSVESRAKDGLRMYVISIDALAPNASAMVTLQTPINDTMRHALYDEHHTFRIPTAFLSADQLWNVGLTVAQISDSTMAVLETDMHSGEKSISMADKVESWNLDPSDPALLEEDVSYRLLPTTPNCPVETDRERGEFGSQNK
ncbi:MAG: hypothetical protein E8D41_11455 [Nitrospira sp.]|nr:MAG: hypothetical protein E8D41_11455 [Nitrospira sp.]